jgi:hypothetical protein
VLTLIALVLALVLLVVCLTGYRISRNVGPRDLEDYARHNHVIYIPVQEQLAAELQDWSKPVRIKLDTHRHPLLGELLVQKATDEPA